MAPCSLLSGGDWKKQSSCVPWPTRSRVSRAGSYGLWSGKPVTETMVFRTFSHLVKLKVKLSRG